MVGKDRTLPMEGALQSVQDFLGGKWQAFLTASESQTHVHVHDTSFLTHNITNKDMFYALPMPVFFRVCGIWENRIIFPQNAKLLSSVCRAWRLLWPKVDTSPSKPWWMIGRWHVAAVAAAAGVVVVVVVGFVVLAINEVDITWITNFHHHHSRLYIIWSAKKMTGSWQRAPLPSTCHGWGYLKQHLFRRDKRHLWHGMNTHDYYHPLQLV